MFQPVTNCWLVSLPSTGFGTLTGPTQLPEELPNMPWMIANSETLPNHVADALERPEVGGETTSLGPFEQDRLELAELVRRQLGISTCATRTTQGRFATRLPSLIPATHRLAADPKLARHLGLRHSSREQPPGFQTPRLFRRIIRATRGIPFYAEWLPQSDFPVTIFCGAQ